MILIPIAYAQSAEEGKIWSDSGMTGIGEPLTAEEAVIGAKGALNFLLASHPRIIGDESEEKIPGGSLYLNDIKDGYTFGTPVPKVNLSGVHFFEVPVFAESGKKGSMNITGITGVSKWTFLYGEETRTRDEPSTGQNDITSTGSSSNQTGTGLSQNHMPPQFEKQNSSFVANMDEPENPAPEPLVTKADSPKSGKPQVMTTRVIEYVDSEDVAHIGERREVFTKMDTQIHVWLHFGEVTDVHDVGFSWYTPVGDLYDDVVFQMGKPGETNDDWYIYNTQDINHEFETNQSLTGEWRIDISLDGEKIHTETFRYQADETRLRPDLTTNGNGQVQEPDETPVMATEDPTSMITPAATRIPRPYSGSLIYGGLLSTNEAYLTLRNAMDNDAVVIITPNGSKLPLAAYFIEKGKSCTIQHVPIGVFNVYYELGTIWDGQSKRFTDGRTSMFATPSGYPEPISYDEMTAGFDLTLYPVAGGNANTVGVGREAFPGI